MGNTKAGEYTAVNAGSIFGSNSVTDVTVPTHDIALVFFHYYDTTVARIVNNSSSLPTLSGASCTHIATIQNGTQSATQGFWCTGAVTGASKTLSYTVDSNDILYGMGISIVFLSGTETASAIRASATDADVDGASTSGALTYVSGDWNILAYTNDNALDQTNGGANTTLITQYQLTDGMYVGVVYKEAATISLPSSTAAYSSIVAAVVKAAGGGGGGPTPGGGDLGGHLKKVPVRPRAFAPGLAR